MKRFLTWIIFLAVIGGAAWWQKEKVVPYVVQHAPFTKPYIAMVPQLAPLTKSKEPDANGAQGDASGAGGKRGGRGAGGPVSVVLAKAQTKSLPVIIEAVGTVQPTASIPIRPRIDNAQIATVDVAEGAKVAQNAQLFTLDDRTIRAQLAQIDAQIDKDQAQIAQTQSDLDRANDLLSRKAGSAVTRDTAATALKVAQAQLAADRAARDATATTLSYTIIRTPVPGRVGSIPIKVGSIIRLSDSTPLATVNQLDPAIVVFAVPQDRLMELRDAMAKGPVRVDAVTAGKTLSGRVNFVENSIDTTTGTVTVKASIPNPEDVLWPGAFVTVQVVLDGAGPTVVVPTASVQLGQQGSYVFVIKDGKTAVLRPITVSRTSGSDTLLSTGVQTGEDVVVDGQLRLVDGASVNIKPAAEDASLVPAQTKG